MTILDCSPCWDGRPDYDPALGTAILLKKDVSRSRSLDTIEPIDLTADANIITADTTNASADAISTVPLFFRSKLTWEGVLDWQGLICNSIEIELIGSTDFELIVYFKGAEVERYSVSQPIGCAGPIPPGGDGGAINDLRTQTNSSNYISMPIRGIDFYDQLGVDPQCLLPFNRTPLSGGSGPTPAPIRTGPDRIFVFIGDKEATDAGDLPLLPGEPGVWPPVDENLRQWDFDILEWIPYVIDADCRPEGDTC